MKHYSNWLVGRPICKCLLVLFSMGLATVNCLASEPGGASDLQGVPVVQGVAEETIQIKRLNKKKPLIDMASFTEAGYSEEDGKNINGPCAIRVPDWLPKEKRVHPQANYYLYFAHHHGKYLRMAWAKKVTGPYKLVGESPLYGSHENAVLALNEVPSSVGKVRVLNHVASPVVTVDNEKHEFKLYFHAPSQLKDKKKRIGQVTFLATSADGLQFHKQLAPYYLGSFYFSPFQVHNRWYAFANHGELWEAPEGGELTAPKGFDATKPLWKKKGRFFDEVIATYSQSHGVGNLIGVRHLSQIVKDDVMHVFFSSREDTPERLYHVAVDVSSTDCKQWKLGGLEMVMEAEVEWEGSKLKPKKSVDGYSPVPVNEIRDTFIYTEGNRHYLFYCAGGERGIGVALLKIND